MSKGCILTSSARYGCIFVVFHKYLFLYLHTFVYIYIYVYYTQYMFNRYFVYLQKMHAIMLVCWRSNLFCGSKSLEQILCIWTPPKKLTPGIWDVFFFPILPSNPPSLTLNSSCLGLFSSKKSGCKCYNHYIFQHGWVSPPYPRHSMGLVYLPTFG